MSIAYLLWHGRRRYLTLLVVLIAVGLVRLGLWQLDRHWQRVAQSGVMIERMSIPPIALAEVLATPVTQREFRNVRVRGLYATDGQILWRNREHQGRTGFHVLTPLVLDDGRAVLVNRGWISYQDGLNEWQSQVPPPPGPQEIVGVWRVSQPNTGQVTETPSVAGWREKWFLIDIPAITAQMPYPLVDGFIDIQPDGTTPAPDQPIPAATGVIGNGNHLSYAVQWFGFAVILLVGYVVAIQRVRRPPNT
jgi:surfeit locus 1 family protein